MADGAPIAGIEGCYGFRAESPAGRMGTVVAVLRRRESGEPHAVIVETGLFVRKLVVLGVSEIESVDAARRRVVLRASGRSGAAGASVSRTRERVAAG